MIETGSDFTGAGAFEQAMLRMKIPYKTIFACDSDHHVRKTFIHNYGMPDYFPDNVYTRDIPKKPLDIYISTPPCQSFSLAGSRKGEKDDRGILFYNTHEFIDKNRPKFFLLENVKGLLSDDGGKTFQRWIEYLGGKSVNGNPVLFPGSKSVPYHIYWKVLNAKDYGIAQNRERVFIIGIRDDQDNDFSFPKKVFLDKRLKDYLEKDVPKKYNISKKMLDGFLRHKERHSKKGNGFGFELKNINDIANSISTKSGERQTDNFIEVKSATNSGFELAEIGEDSINFEQPNSKTRRGRVGKRVAQTITTSAHQGVITYDYPKVKFQLECGFEQNGRIYDQNGIAPTLQTMQGGGREPKVAEVIQLNPSKESGGKQPYKQNRIYDSDGLCPTLDTECGRPSILNGYRVRKLTPRECFRLMDFPDSFTWTVSDTQAYKQAGNSICVGVLVAILEKILKKF